MVLANVFTAKRFVVLMHVSKILAYLSKLCNKYILICLVMISKDQTLDHLVIEALIYHVKCHESTMQ